jgi:hypothetical protein
LLLVVVVSMDEGDAAKANPSREEDGEGKGSG